MLFYIQKDKYLFMCREHDFHSILMHNYGLESEKVFVFPSKVVPLSFCTEGINSASIIPPESVEMGISDSPFNVIPLKSCV